MENLEYKDWLEQSIIKARETRTEEAMEMPVKVLAEMHKKDAWIIMPCFHDENNNQNIKLFHVPEHEEFGNFIVVYTDAKYLQSVFGTDLIYMSVRKVVDLMNAYGENCNGLIVNPATFHAEAVLFKDSINKSIANN